MERASDCWPFAWCDVALLGLATAGDGTEDTEADEHHGVGLGFGDRIKKERVVRFVDPTGTYYLPKIIYRHRVQIGPS